MKDPAAVVMQKIQAQNLDRRAALAWWRALTAEQQVAEHMKSDRHHWSFSMFSTSTSAITAHWRKHHAH